MTPEERTEALKEVRFALNQIAEIAMISVGDITTPRRTEILTITAATRPYLAALLEDAAQPEKEKQ